MKRVILFLSFILLGNLDLSYALDWHRLHEDADKKTVEQASINLRINPDSLDDLYVMGLVNLNQHKDKEAEQSFNEILRLAPGTKEAAWGIAEVLRRRHELEKSETILKEVIRSYSDFSPAYISLAYIKYIKLDFEESVNLAYQVIRQGLDAVDASNYCRAYLLVGGGKGMIAHFGGPLSKAINGTKIMPNLRRAERLKPDSPGVLFGLGSFYLLAPTIVGGDLDKAGDYLKKAIEADPLFVDAYVRLAQFYKLKGDNIKYQEYLDKALGIDCLNELALDITSKKCNYICVP
jgi:tetratricopeptide (TPR) repeat protein